MKKAIKLLLLLLFFQATSTAQFSIDSIHVFQSSGQIVDPVYVQGVSNGQVFNRVLRSPANDLCGALYISMYFQACNPNQSTPFNTTIQFGFLVTLSGYPLSGIHWQVVAFPLYRLLLM